MATNKHAQIRYIALDKCFCNFTRKYYIEDLITACNDALYEYTGVNNGVSRRQIYDDINFMQSEEGWSVPLKKFRDGQRIYYRYETSDFSIKIHPLTPTELCMMQRAIFMLNNFKGIPQIDYLKEALIDFQTTFHLNEDIKPVVFLDENPDLAGLQFFTPIYNSILNRLVLNITFNNNPKDKELKTVTLHPYFLKQYYCRWYVFGHNPEIEDVNYLDKLSLSNIESIKVIDCPYLSNDNLDVNDYFYDVVGVNILPGQKLKKVRFRIDDVGYSYIHTRPLHPSQRVISRDDDSVVVELKLIPNFEFECALMMYADHLQVLEPESLREAITKRAETIVKKQKGK
jgi:predicted DNA-binding transcriptional regulator YafY